uniref:Adenine DNA glycosylase n=1 Tax=Kalanchoe fedtschenkoi TaxID=63787 RepID=A0A7N0UBM7_KALFE
MELGATICSPLSPSCTTCPISRHCQALSISTSSKSVCVTDYPAKVIKAKQRPEFSAVCVVEIREEKDAEGGFILIRRPDEGLLAGLWEFPSIPVDENASLAAKRKAVDHFLKKSFNLVIGKTCVEVLREDVGEYIHIFSHIRLKLFVELLVLHLKDGMNVLSANQDQDAMTWKCVDGKALSSMGLTSSVRKVYTMIQKFKKTGQAKPTPVASRKRRTRET